MNMYLHYEYALKLMYLTFNMIHIRQHHSNRHAYLWHTQNIRTTVYRTQERPSALVCTQDALKV